VSEAGEQTPTPAEAPADETADPNAPSQSVAKYALFSVVAIVFTVLDQVTKIWVRKNLTLYDEGIPVIPGFFDIVHAENPGAAFGMLGGAENRMIFFAIFTVIAVGVLGQMLWQLPKDDRLQNLALAFITSGAIGNAIDRVQKQSVTDFLRIYTDNPSAKAKLVEWFGTAEWPSFNVADAAIVIGLGLFVVHWFFFERDADDAESPADAKAAPS
jgi:signal peptidase II